MEKSIKKLVDIETLNDIVPYVQGLVPEAAKAWNTFTRDSVEEDVFVGMVFGLYVDLHSTEMTRPILDASEVLLGRMNQLLKEWIIRKKRSNQEDTTPIPELYEAYTAPVTTRLLQVSNLRHTVRLRWTSESYRPPHEWKGVTEAMENLKWLSELQGGGYDSQMNWDKFINFFRGHQVSNRPPSEKLNPITSDGDPSGSIATVEHDLPGVFFRESNDEGKRLITIWRNYLREVESFDDRITVLKDPKNYGERPRKFNELKARLQQLYSSMETERARFVAYANYDVNLGNLINAPFNNLAHRAIGAEPRLITPVPGTILPGSRVKFVWTPSDRVVDEWELRVGVSPSGEDFYPRKSFPGDQQETVVTGLPTNGQTIHVTLRYRNDEGPWESKEYQFIGTKLVGAMTSPPPNSTLSNSTVTVGWTAYNSPIDEWELQVGTYPSGEDLYPKKTFPGDQEGTVVTGLPTNGQTIYITLRYRNDEGPWESKDYQFIATTLVGAITTPPPNSTLSDSTVTFGWTAYNSPVDEWWLWVGTMKGNDDICDSMSLENKQYVTVHRIPENGLPVWVRLFFRVRDGQWENQDFEFQTNKRKDK